MYLLTLIDSQSSYKPFPPPPVGLQIHPLLASSSHAGLSQRPFVWDLRDLPSNIVSCELSHDSAYPIPAASLAIAAITPPTDHVEIHCMQLPWKLTVTPSQRFKNIHVTVGDVMSELYNVLRLQISQEEFKTACRGNLEYQKTIEAAYERRVTWSQSPTEERSKGIRRIDVLGDCTIFAGFDVVAGSTNSLMLLVRPQD